MKRKLPNIANHPPLTYTKAPDVVESTRRYKIITPLLGGGTESYKNDEHTLIRVSSIRGVLRFWWRATRGGLSHGDARHLRRLEARIWGGNCQYTAKVAVVAEVVQSNGTFADGMFTWNGYTVRWLPSGLFSVHHEQSCIYYDVKINPHDAQAVINAQNVTIVHAEIVDDERPT